MQIDTREDPKDAEELARLRRERDKSRRGVSTLRIDPGVAGSNGDTGLRIGGGY